MTRYLYHCDRCNQGFEVEKSMSQSGQNENCPVCQIAGQRVFTAPGISVKGAKIKFASSSEKCAPQSCHGCAGDAGCQLD